MIAIIRRRFGKQAFNIVIWITLFSLAAGIFVTGIFKRFSGVSVTSVADVNGYEVTPREFQKKVAQEEYQISQIRQQFGKNANMILQAYGLLGKTEDRALKSLITQKLLLSAADSIGITLSEEYVSSKLLDSNFARQLLGDMLPPHLITGATVNYKELVKGLARQGVSPQYIEHLIEERLKEQLVVTLASAATFVPEEEVRDAFNKVYRPRKYLVAKIPLAPYLKKEQDEKVSDDVLKKFYEETKDRSSLYWRPEKRSARFWTFENVPQGFMVEGEKVINQKGPAFDEFVKKYKGVADVYPLTDISTLSHPQKRDLVHRKMFSTALGARALEVAGAEGSKKGYVIEVTAMEPRVLLEYGAVKDKVADTYARKQALLKLDDDLEDLKGMDSAQRTKWVQEHKGTETTTGFISLDKPEDFKELQKEGIQKHQLSELEDKGSRVAMPTAHDGYMIELLEYGPFDEKLYKEKRGELLRTLTNEDVNRTLLNFIASLEKNAKIKTNKSFFNRR